MNLENKIASEIGEKVSEHMVMKQGIIETLIETQLASKSDKRLDIVGDSYKISVFSSNGKLLKIKSDDGEEGLSALKQIQLGKMSYSESDENNINLKKQGKLTLDKAKSVIRGSFKDQGWETNKNIKSGFYFDHSGAYQLDNTIPMPEEDVLNYLSDVITILEPDQEATDLMQISCDHNNKTLQFVIAADYNRFIVYTEDA